MKVTTNFSVEEFDCEDGTKYPEEWIESRLKPLCLILEKLRKYLGPLTITSGYRTPNHNKAVPGAAKVSEHIQGRAADFQCNLPLNEAFGIIMEKINNGEIPDGGLHLYKKHIHYDTGRPRRW